MVSNIPRATDYVRGKFARPEPMSSSSSWYPDKRPPSDRPPAEAPSGPDLSATENELLEAVLRRTMAMEGEGKDCTGLRSAVEAVVRRYNGQPLDWERAIGSLVEVVLREEFRQRPRWAGLWPGLSRKIARILWEDPHSRSRLEALWARLSGG
jgi:hypothetical protein